MTSNLDALLPDFEDMNAVANEASRKRLEAHLAKDELDVFIAGCIDRAYRDQTLWVNGKPPVQTYIDRVVAVRGNTSDDAAKIKELTLCYLELQKESDEARSLLLAMRDQLAAFQTVSSNKRAGIT